MSKLVFLDYLNDYNINGLRDAVENSFRELNIKDLIKPNMKILIKACLPEAISKDNAETTHPAVVRALVDVLSKMGAKSIIADSPEGGFNEEQLSSVYLNTGMLEMANLTTCELNNNLRTTNIEVPNGVKTKRVTVLDVINEVDAIINVGKLKFDDNLGYIGASANLLGLIPGDMKSVVRNRLTTLGDYNDYIIDIYETLKDKVVLNVIDAIVSLEANNTQRMLNCLAMSPNAYALDATMFDILNIKYENTILKQAKNREIIDFNKPYKVIGEKIERFKLTDFSILDFDNTTEMKHSKNYFKTHQQRPTIGEKKCKGCKICSKICPTNAIIMKYDKRGELYAEIDYKKCIFCNKCITACPYNVVKQKTPIGYKLIMKEIEKFNK